MRTLHYLPLVAAAGVDGFVMFLPYLGVVFVTAYVLSRIRVPAQIIAAQTLAAQPSVAQPVGAPPVAATAQRG